MKWVSLIANFLFKVLVPFAAFLAGKRNREAADAEQKLDDIREVKDIHYNIEVDKTERDKIRDLYK